MHQVQLYKNAYSYPNFSNSLTEVGSPFSVIPVDINLRNGSILFQEGFTFLKQANYLKITIDNSWSIYGFIDDIRYHSGDKRYQIDYTVDAFRTYKDSITFGTQFIKRAPTVSNTIDPLLRSANGLSSFSTQELSLSGLADRYLVVVLSSENKNTYTDYPIQPNPYLTYLTPYTSNRWSSNTNIVNLVGQITSREKPLNLVSVYSIPYFAPNMSGVMQAPFTLQFSDGPGDPINGFFYFMAGYFESNSSPSRFLSIPKPPETIRRTPHSFTLIIPEAGLINIPTEVMFDSRPLFLWQDIDISTGSSNYMLVFDDGVANYSPVPLSARGGGIAGLPIAYNPEQQLMAVNQTNRTTSLLGDVAGAVIGGAQIVGGLMAAPATGGVSLAMVGSGAMQAGSSIFNAFTRDEALKDSLHTYSNPPSYLGSALLARYPKSVFLVTQSITPDNEALVHSQYGYPQNKLMTLTLPASGFIQTQECNVSGLNVPEWARQEINQRLDQGIRFV